jgi:hypothetical protein
VRTANGPEGEIPFGESLIIERTTLESVAETPLNPFG